MSIFNEQQTWEIKKAVREELKRIFDTGCMGTEQVTPKFEKPTVTVGKPVAAPTVTVERPMSQALMDLMKVEGDYVKLKEYMDPEVWADINDDMKGYGYKYVKGKGWTR